MDRRRWRVALTVLSSIVALASVGAASALLAENRRVPQERGGQERGGQQKGEQQKGEQQKGEQQTGGEKQGAKGGEKEQAGKKKEGEQEEGARRQHDHRDPRRVREADKEGAREKTAGDSAVEHPRCGLCKTTGRVPFEFDPRLVAKEGRALRCSEVVGREDENHGIEFVPCLECHSPVLQAQMKVAWETARKQRLDWLAERREIDEFLNDKRRLKITHCATEHFDIVWSIPKVKVGRKIYRQHEAMHLYADRLQEVYEKYLEQFSLIHSEQQNGIRHTVMCFEMAKHSQRAQPKYTGIGGFTSSGAKLLGIESVFVCYWDKTENRSDEEFHEYVVHNASHMFQCSAFNQKWLARKHGWVDAGFAHYITERIFGKCRTHCYQEQDEVYGWELNPWRPATRKRVGQKKIPSFAEVSRKKTETLTAGRAPVLLVLGPVPDRRAHAGAVDPVHQGAQGRRGPCGMRCETSTA